ncbi:O-antigen ligase family protein [Ectobacillus polymachus]|uniref:O-antigen ligase family protein n=1 Tax=Ectobacillus polymachus TaxID=1508806 RepID=UPI003A838342
MKKKVDFSIIWFSIGLCFTTATQLRIHGLPIGPGEIMLFLWIVIKIFWIFKKKEVILTPLSRNLTFFWFFLFLFLTIGTLCSAYLGILYPFAAHSFFAYLFSCLLIIVLSFERNLKIKVITIAKILVSITVLVSLLLLIFSTKDGSIGPINSWHSSPRFAGWAIDNQLALDSSILLYLSLYLSTIAKTYLLKTWYFGLAVACVWIGIETQSDALFTAFSVGFSILFITFWLKKITNSQMGYWTGAWWKVWLPIMICFTVLIFGSMIYKGVNQNVSTIYYSQGDKGDLRVALWENGLKAMETSPIFGLGPGAFSGGTAPFQGMEAHNTFVDIGTNIGLVGLILYIGLLCWISYLLILKKEVVLFTGLVTVMFFNLFHFIIRHPIYWFYLLFILSISIDQEKSTVKD